MSFWPVSSVVKYFHKKKELKQFRESSPEDIFTGIYQDNKWRNAESASGTGSSMERTAIIRQELPQLLNSLNAKSLLDIPCGDFYWMQTVQLPVAEYIGADIVSAMVEKNQQAYGNSQRQFRQLNLISDTLPKVDVVLSRDALVHFSFEHIQQAIANIRRSGSTYICTTHFPQYTANKDIVTGKHRPLNFQLPPFNWPPPLQQLIEYSAGKRGDKCLGVWNISEL
ncbi:MAG: hypothetical protein COC19_08225 [SAR86 cluster bacterium]|uniref:Methyltransferase type 11 domain-containing protein n=1 Tax=SAR86 cluster bacterium TaxID=2030880 RepID=A0A2A4MGA8_9GAMM|nr:MAG: hypothetical protein COC19_08225 [SAR86 cluster bacterium]